MQGSLIHGPTPTVHTRAPEPAQVCLQWRSRLIGVATDDHESRDDYSHLVVTNSEVMNLTQLQRALLRPLSQQ